MKYIKEFYGRGQESIDSKFEGDHALCIVINDNNMIGYIVRTSRELNRIIDNKKELKKYILDNNVYSYKITNNNKYAHGWPYFKYRITELIYVPNIKIDNDYEEEWYDE